ncbi:addiction module protein [candidate division KSB1 bacterium]|nr:addiction module protein [candidate division KSB1 bacterium]MBL7093018.1 addiction module protein [candidate division KSB1 bacterium]
METTITKENLLKDAKLLNPVERLQLIESLLESLDKPDHQIEQLWINEADARHEAYKRGELKSTDWEDIKKRYK